jgi:hypothetical protein
LVYIDDVAKGFRIERLYSIITGTWQVNKKYKEEVNIPFAKSPKLVLTSNYAIGSSDDSTKRRIHNFPVVKHFNADYTPYDLFKRRFFDDWDVIEWNRYYNYLCFCAAEYLRSDRKLGSLNNRYNERALINDTNPDFIEYMDSLLSVNFHPWILENEIKVLRYTDDEGRLHTNGVDMTLYNPARHRALAEKNVFITTLREKLSNPKLTMTMVTLWLKQWAKSRGCKVDCQYRIGRAQKMYYRIIVWKPQILAVTTGGQQDGVYNINSGIATKDDGYISENVEVFSDF